MNLCNLKVDGMAPKENPTDAEDDLRRPKVPCLPSDKRHEFGGSGTNNVREP